MTQSPTIGNLHEQEANSVIAEWLNGAGCGWQADAERSGALAGSGERPDIIIHQDDRMPVIVECEYGRPAVDDAARRLGRTLQGENRPFTEAIAVGIDDICRRDTRAGLRRRLDDGQRIFTIQLVTESGGVWPDFPLVSAPADLIAYCEYSQVPQDVIERESENIAQSVYAAGNRLLNGIGATVWRGRPTLDRLREIVGGQGDLEVTCAASAIWLIAIDLQNDLANNSAALRKANLKTTQQVREAENSLGLLMPEDMLDSWRIIRQVNYLPVMDLAIDSLRAGVVPDLANISEIMINLERVSRRLNTLHAKHIYNFAGELWQRLVGDREERASHYTRPEIAELLAVLSAQRFQNRSAEEIAGLNLMDAACGTGTLIGAGERALRRLYAMKGGRDPELHRKRMEEHVIALDINGIAGTLTAKRLTDMDVTQDYAKSKIAVVTHQAGSLSLLDPRITGITDYLGYGGVAATPGLNSELGLFHIAHGSIHWALMNPPYSRPRKGRVQATTGLDRLRPLAARSGWKMSHGQAGLASDFGNMCNMRMAPQGIFAHVLPLTAAHSGSWQSWRAELEKDFENIVAIANVSSAELQSMSADTDMGEMLVIATKRSKRPQRWRPTEILCVNLDAAPATLAEGYAMAKEIAAIPEASHQGMLYHGSYTRFQHNGAGFPWGAVGNSNNELAQVITALLNGTAYDPLTLAAHELALPTAALGDMANTGPTHHTIGYISGPTHDIIGHPRGGDGRGAFEWTPMSELSVSSAQQSMWAADAKAQKTILAEPTHSGTVIDNEIARQMVQRRSQWFLSRNLRWTSQSVAAANTAKLVHGGRAWNAMQGLSNGTGQCMALYYNSVFGAIVRNAYGQSTQAGRSPVQVGAIPGLPCPAFHADTPEAQRARDIAGERFDELARLTLEPFAYCFRDANRHRIDSTVAEMLGLDSEAPAIREMLAYYRTLFAREPNVNGRQKPIVAALGKYRNS